jgi:hypothetical protein
MQPAAVKVKVQKMSLVCTEKCCNVYHILLYFEFFIPQTVESMSKNKKKHTPIQWQEY